MGYLEDGTYLPSFLSHRDTSTDSHVPSMTEVALRVGEVVKVYYPGDSGNDTSNIQYIVNVVERDGQGLQVTVPYRCSMMDQFGGVADSCRFLYRPATFKDQDQTPTNGNWVIIACPNESASLATIICGIKNNTTDNNNDSGTPVSSSTSSATPDPSRVDGNDSNSDNRFFKWVFNGVKQLVNDSGEFLIAATGATLTNGAADPNNDPDNKGPFLQFTKAGDIILSDNNGDVIQYTSKEQRISISAGYINAVAAKDAQLWGNSNTFIGSTDASEPLVLGNQLTLALQQLVTIFLSNASAVGIQGNNGFPVPLSPAIATALNQWLQKYTLSQGTEPPPILATDKFTER